ncbi:Alcohol dehydrogenase, class IV [Ferrimonas sediminum]|uniref:Alcohol dehydrogenase, class IV n=1 Tax=Ferrimonas sediminum TaxID=718193 RepID=A0A1G8TUM7_9GAMM|nr:iron-containing alcohol dehydrogenase [Ferrimonas sediminum]SDJ45248.1 Alcohol dehydrogenase, class IV [Ferrimonas sediminum]
MTQTHASSSLLFALRQRLYRLWAAIARPIFRSLPIATPEVLSGDQSLDSAIARLAESGYRRPVVITDNVFVTLPVFGRLIDALERYQLTYSVFSDIVPDPDFTLIEAGISHCRQHQFDSVIAIGGGSSIDATKVINGCAHNQINPRKIVGLLKLRKKGAFFVAIPTTAGTGSEATAAAVITDEQSHQKKVVVSLSVVPDLAVLDASLMMGLPPAITAATGMDALTHAMESYLSRFATAETDAMNLASIKRIFTYLPRAFSQGQHDVEARQEMALASHQAGVTFTRTSVGWVHAIAHQLGARYGVPHGLANAMVLPHVLAFYLPFASARMAQMADAIGIEGDSDQHKAEALVNAVTELCQTLAITPELTMLKEADLESMSDNIISETYRSPYPVPGYFDSQGQLQQFLRGMMA